MQQYKMLAEITSVGEDKSEAKKPDNKPDMVRFPGNWPNIPPLKLEVEESEREMSPRNLWQVYAVGGFCILRWVCARWSGRKPKDESSVGDH